MISATDIEDHALKDHKSVNSDNKSINFYAHLIKQIEFIKFKMVNKDINKAKAF